MSCSSTRRRVGALAAAAVTMGLVATCAYAQSISDIDLQAFQGLTGKETVQAHTDPFASGSSAAEDLTVEDLQLSGIVFGGGDSYALISGYLVRPGDLIAGYRVDAIEKDRVRLRRINDVFVLVLGGGI